MFANRYDPGLGTNAYTTRSEESARRPSADFKARFKEQHFSPESRTLISSNIKGEDSDQSVDPSGPITQMYDLDPTPKGTGAHAFRFTPSLLDPNSSAFAAFAAQPPGYYTPTPGGSTIAFQSYDLPVNTQMFGTNTPDSLSHHSNQETMQGRAHFQPMNTIDPEHYIHYRPHPYTQDSYHNLAIPGSGLPGACSESSSNYSPETASGAETTESEVYIASEVPGNSTFISTASLTRNSEIYGQCVPSLLSCNSPFRFRFATTLHAATAMLRHSSDIPVTYLNKRQAYAVSVVDNSPAVQNNDMKRYRTTVRIAFDEEDQRRTAPACWRLWKDGRGTLESGGNPDKLRAIDFEPTETQAVNEKKANVETSLQVEDGTTSFDRFTVTWSTTSSKPTVYFCVRFLFLSTDFSHSKGVKGVPVRLVAKTEMLTSDAAFNNKSMNSELCYCKIKLFRDKGAERKLANDRQHLERAVEKMRQQAHQITSGVSDNLVQATNKKKKRHSFTGVSTTTEQNSPPSRRHRRDWSISSNASAMSNSGNPRSQEDEAQRKLDKADTMEVMFSSIRPVSIFSLVGDPADDPGLSFSPIAPQSQWEAPGTAVYTADPGKLNFASNTSHGSPALSQASFSSVTSEKLGYTGTSPLSHPLSPPANARISVSAMAPPLSGKAHVQAVTKEIDAMDVDPFYVPLPMSAIRPALCIYIAPTKIGPNSDPHTMHFPTAVDTANELYYAVYVPVRTASALTVAIATKLGLDVNSIVRTTIVNKRGLRLALDDDVTREMLEKQDMRVSVGEVEWTCQEPNDDMKVDKQSVLELFLAY